MSSASQSSEQGYLKMGVCVVMGPGVYLSGMFPVKSCRLMTDDLRCKEQHLHLLYNISPAHSALSSCCSYFTNGSFAAEMLKWCNTSVTPKCNFYHFCLPLPSLFFFIIIICMSRRQCEVLLYNLNISTLPDSGCLGKGKKISTLCCLALVQHKLWIICGETGQTFF